MAQSNHLRIHWLFVGVEVILFAVAVVTAYLSEQNEWTWFFWISAPATLMFAITRIASAIPEARRLLVHEEQAAKLATSMIKAGVVDWFDMLQTDEQQRRNAATQQAIGQAQNLWLCANSGASYLDPSIYRHWAFVKERLAKGAEFRVVILDPRSREKAFRNKLSVGGEQFDSKVNVASLIKLYNEYPGIDIRFVKNGMHSTVFGTDTCLFMDPYHVGLVDGRIENRTFCVQIKPTESAGANARLYQIFRSHFTTLWQSGVSIEDWGTEAEESGAQLPTVRRRYEPNQP